MEMTRTESGLLIPAARPTQAQFDAERRAASDKYYGEHACCPECGRQDLSQTTVGYIAFPGQQYCDGNKAWCSCGWKGIVDQMVPSVLTQSGDEE